MQQPGSITFGRPITPASSTVPTFGVGTGLSFGASPAPSFGAPTSTNAGLNFGSPAANTGLKFGTPTSTPSLFGSPAPQAGLSFGATPATSAGTGFSFGTPTNTATTGLNFSSGGTATPGVPTFGTPASTTATGLTFGTPITSASPGFGMGFKSPATTTTSLGFGTTPGIGGIGTTPALNFGLGGGSTGITTTTTTPSLFGGGGLTGGLFAPKPPGAPTLGGPPAQQPPPSLGLGGVDTFQNKPGTTGATANEADGKLAKENPLPNEFTVLMEGFKNHVKQQKMFSSDVARSTIKPLRKIQEDIDVLKLSLTEIGNGLITNRQMVEKLKFDTAKCLSHAEMAQRTHDTPPGFQFDNTAPLQFFIETVNQFENELGAIRQQIEATEKHIQSLEKPKTLSSQEMALGMRRLHETFVALAGRLQSLHSQVEVQKDQYLNLRKHVLKDATNIFDKPSQAMEALKKAISSVQSTPPKRAAGPTPFSTLGNTSLGFITQPQTVGNPTAAPPPAYPGMGNSSLSWGTPSAPAVKPAQPPSYSASVSGLLFGSQTASPSNDNFQLQKPPTGNKRGKH